MRYATTALLPCFLLAACVAAPPTEPSQHKIAISDLGLDQSSETRPAPDWWKGFGDAELDHLVADAFAGNPSLAAALARMRSAAAGLAAERAATWPQISLDASEQRDVLSGHYLYPPPYAGSTQWIGTVEGGLSWNIDLWGRQSAIVAAAGNTAKAAKFDAEAARLALAEAVTQTYIALAAAYRSCDVTGDVVTLRGRELKLATSRLQNGLDNRSALHSAEEALAAAKVADSACRADHDRIVHTLAALTGRGADAYNTIGRPSLDLARGVTVPQSLPADLIAQRPDVLAAGARVEAAVQGRKVAYTAFFPNVDLLAAAGWSALGLSNLFTSNAVTYGGGPAIHLPLFDAGLLRAEYAGATADLDAATAAYNGAVASAIRQAADAGTEVKALTGQLADQNAAVAAAEHKQALAASRVHNGLSPESDNLAARGSLFAEKQKQIALEAASASQCVALIVAVGGGFVPESNTQPEPNKGRVP
jgi:NodT family efflux transporter outer membrane factor (OMF) lipoprotein